MFSLLTQPDHLKSSKRFPSGCSWWKFIKQSHFYSKNSDKPSETLVYLIFSLISLESQCQTIQWHFTSSWRQNVIKTKPWTNAELYDLSNEGSHDKIRWFHPLEIQIYWRPLKTANFLRSARLHKSPFIIYFFPHF